MNQLPKIVTARLARAKTGDHLDPDLLAAFAEKALRQSERAQVLEHLSGCSDCRETLILAMPEIETRLTPVHSPSRWLQWPVLRWGALATCVVIVAAAVSLRNEWGGTQRERLASGQPSTQVAEKPKQSLADEAATAPQPTSPQQISPQPFSRDANAIRPAQKPAAALDDKTLPSSNQPAASPRPSRIGIAASAPALAKTAETDGNQDKRNQDEYGKRKQAEDAPSLQALASKEAPSENPSTRSEAAASGSGSEPAVDGFSAMKPDGSSAAKSEPQEPKKSTMSAGAMSSRLAPNVAPNENLRGQDTVQMASGSNAKPRWTVTSEGALLRSVDAGKTWQAIPFNGKISFRAVATSGLEVWVGGAAGTLYHSADAGEHWLQVTPVADGQSLTADIISVEFVDSLHGRLATARQETWITSDAGQTWHKQ